MPLDEAGATVGVRKFRSTEEMSRDRERREIETARRSGSL
jgi:hypothetical protein